VVGTWRWCIFLVVLVFFVVACHDWLEWRYPARPEPKEKKEASGGSGGAANGAKKSGVAWNNVQSWLQKLPWMRR
jgi:hypothetical protein